MYYFDDIVKKDNPKLFQGGQIKIITDGESIPFDTNDVIDYTKKDPYFSFVLASTNDYIARINAVVQLSMYFMGRLEFIRFWL